MPKPPPGPSREWDSSAYHRISAPQFAWGLKVLDRVPLGGNETVLDAGCGTGRLTAELLRRLPHARIVAADLSHNMLETAKASLSGSQRVRFVNAHLLQLPFHPVFDGIFSTATFHWISDHSRLFRELLGALRPRGWLVAQCGGGPNLKRLLDRVWDLSQSTKYAPHIGGYRYGWEYSDAETAASRLRSAGFEDIETSLEKAPTRFDDATLYREFISKVILHRHLER
ncbi:MAG TPA: class I SAM-dependent methyltransferase, partial [Terriglobales bacterium]